jgi:DNA-binding transcriptional LysR family regulator
MDRWTEIELFVQVAELGSLTRAAESLGLSNAAASRHLAALEERLAARLVQRNTRRLFLTDVGETFYRRCKPLLAELHEAESGRQRRRAEAHRHCCASPAVAVVQHDASSRRRLPEFTERYPDLRVEIVAVQPLLPTCLDSGIDVAIRNA